MLTLQEYLNYEVESDRRYEIEGGEIVEMPPESFASDRLALWLMLELTKVVNYTQITNKAEIIVSGSRVNVRIPPHYRVDFDEAIAITEPFVLTLKLINYS